VLRPDVAGQFVYVLEKLQCPSTGISGISGHIIFIILCYGIIKCSGVLITAQMTTKNCERALCKIEMSPKH
jgi:hypothetical protein